MVIFVGDCVAFEVMLMKSVGVTNAQTPKE